MFGLEPGYLFGGKYRILEAIGAGGMGAVYLACDPRYDDFRVAIKVLYPGVIKTREARERFRNEIIACYKANHRNIVRAYEYFDEEQFQAYAMEYVEGGDLLERMEEGKLSVDEVVSVLRQTAEGLAAVHAQGIVHRDLKPENILITNKGLVKITDFGVALLKDKGSTDKEGSMVGTPKYVAPEYIETGETDHRGDIYALGVIAYELLSGESPFRSETSVSLMVERLKLQVEPLAKVCDAPREIIRIVEKMMAVSLADRYLNTEDLVEDLKAYETAKTWDQLDQEDDGPEDSAEESAEEILPLASGAIEPKVTTVTESSGLKLSKKKPIWTKPIFLLSVVLLLSIPLILRFGAQPTVPFLMNLQEGRYVGEIQGIFSESEQHPLIIWKTERGVFALLVEPSCRVSKVDSSGRFSCGDIVIHLREHGVDNGRFYGSATEESWGVQGSWSFKGGLE